MDNTKIDKSAETQLPIHPILKRRWSPRTFSDMPLSAADIKTLFEAGRWAPSSNNIQPWALIWGTHGSKAFDRIFGCLAEFNQLWVKNAPLLVLTAYNKKKPDGEENFHALHDLGLFVANLTFQAEHMGIGVHQMAGIDFEKAKEEFKLPEDFHVSTAIAIGYYGGDVKNLPEELRDQEKDVERERKSQIEFTFNGDYVEREELNS